MAKVSVIIPVYNVEKYLKECLDSVINQTLKDIEIICINDGSTDNSLTILEEYAAKDSRIKLINQENQGVGTARNNGIEKSSAPYIMFLDSDDYFMPQTCQKAYETIIENNSDIGIFGNYKLLEQNIINEYENWQKATLEIAQENNYADFQVYLWDKIYKKEFLNKYNLRIIKNLKTSEDVIFSWLCNFKKPKYCIISSPLYVYRAGREHSATNKPHCIQSDIEAFKILYNTPDFKKQSLDVQLDIVNRFCGGSVYYLNKFYRADKYKIVRKDSLEFIKYLNTIYSKNDLKKLKNYKKIICFALENLIRDIFSIRNSDDKTTKIISILGFKFYKKLNKH